MRTLYSDLNISFVIEGISFYALNIVFERFQRSIPKHSHGAGSYEIHYIPYGKGTAVIEGKVYHVLPGTLYVTGPHIEHEQTPDKYDPMSEYCIYLKVQKYPKKKKEESFLSAFFDTSFWFGPDTQEMHPLMQQLFLELEHNYTGYMTQVETLLTQCVVKVIRNYRHQQESKKHFAVQSLVDSKYIIVEESFLYEYDTLTLQALSTRLMLSARQTERFLQETYGRTFLQKKNEARMSAATVLLMGGEKSVTEIAVELGYSSVEHFSHAFRRYFGLSALAYKKEHEAPLQESSPSKKTQALRVFMYGWGDAERK